MSSATVSTPRRRVVRLRRARTVLLAAVVPFVLVAGALAWSVASWPQPPLDAVGDLGESFSVMVITVIGILPALLLFGGTALLAPGAGPARRHTVAWALGIAGFAAAHIVRTTQAVRAGVDTAGPPTWEPVALGVGAVLGVLGWWLAGPDPRLPADRPVDPRAPRWPLAPGQKVAWHARLRPRGRDWLVTLIPHILWTAWSMYTLIVLNQWWWWLALFLYVLLAVRDLSWTVRVNAAGVHVRAWMGRPNFSIPADEILAAEVTRMMPMPWLYGGLRFEDGKVKLRACSGPGILIHATAGRRYLIVAPGAEEAVRTINTLADRARVTGREARTASAPLLPEPARPLTPPPTLDA